MNTTVTPLRYLLGLLPLLFLPLVLQAQSVQRDSHTPIGSMPTQSPSAPTLSVRFTENRGQIVDFDYKPRPDILYKASRSGTSLFFFKDRISYVFSRFPEGYHENRDRACSSDEHDHEGEAPHGDNPCSDHAADQPEIEFYRVDLEFIGMNPDVKVTADKQAKGYSNYYLGHCPGGITNVPSFHELTYKGIYPGIDMVIRSTDNGSKCDFIVHPGAKVSDIRMRYLGAERIEVNPDGSLRVSTSLGYIQEEAPYTYQGALGVGAERKIQSRFTLMDGIVGFAIGAYDRSKPLVIDPNQLWATFLGGGGEDRLNGADPTEVDRQGNVLITGYTNSTNFPTKLAHQPSRNGTSDDAFLSKFSPLGAFEWSTYFGGTSSEISHAVATDKNGEVFISGHTESSATSFPILNCQLQASYGGSRDAFVAKFSSGGMLHWSTYYGGSGLDDGYGFAVDSTDSVAVVISTLSTQILSINNPDPIYPDPYQPNPMGGRDALVVKIGKDGHGVWATYLGGTSTDWGYAVASDINDNIILSGWTNSTNFPRRNEAQSTKSTGYDAYVSKFNRYGALQWSTYWGGGGNENDNYFSSTGTAGIATDVAGNVFVTGTTSGSFPTRNALYPTFSAGTADAFLVKFNPEGVVQWSTYLGGGGRDLGTGVATNVLGGVLVTGLTSGNMPVSVPPQSPPFKGTNSGGTDAYIMKLDPDGQILQWGTYFGGTGNDEAHGISFDPHGSIIIAGQTTSNGPPFAFNESPAPPPYQPTNLSTLPSTLDAFISVFCDSDPLQIDSSGPKTLCADETITLSIIDGFFNIKWYKVGVSAPFATGVNSVTISDSGRYFVTVTNAASCLSKSDTIKIAKFGRFIPTIAGLTSVCTGDSINLSAVGGPYAKYTWRRDDVVIPGATTAILKVKQGGTYKVLVENSFGCKDSSEIHTVIEHPMPTAISVTPADTVEICQGLSATLTATGGVGGVIEWSNGAGGNPLTVTQQGFYFARAINVGTGCSTVSNRVYVKVNPKPTFTITALLPLEFCEGDSTVLVASRTDYAKYVWLSPNGTEEGVTRIVVKKSGSVRLTVTDAKGCINEAEVLVTVYERPKAKINQTGPIIKCEGDSVMLALNGGSFTSVVWSNGSIGVPAKITRSGKYYAIVTGPGGCRENSDTIDITFTPAPDARISGPQSVCTNSSGSYSVPNQPGATYLWEVTGTGASLAAGQNTPNIDVNWGPIGAGTVKVTVTHTASGCKATTTITVNVGSVLVPTITVRPKTTICPGDSTVLDAGPNYASYAWSNGATSRTITVGQAGTYTVTVANAGGCSGTSDPVTITVVQPPKPGIVPSRSTTLCPGDTVFLSVSAPYEDYLWSGGQTIDEIAVTQAGTYTVTVVDSNGCSGTSDPVVVTIATPPAPVISGPNSVCINSTQTYSVPAVSGDSYLWNVTGGVLVGPNNTASINVQWPAAGAGLIQVTQTSGSFGCVDSTEYAVTVGTSLQPQVTASGSTLICIGDSITLIAPDGYASYLWDDGSVTRSIVVAQPGTYSVTVTDNGGCSGSGDITITQKAPLAPKIVPDGRPGLCQGDSLRLEATGGFDRYLWSTGDTTQSIWVKQAGSYTVTVFDADSCSDVSGIVDVVVYPLLSTPVIEGIGDTLVALVDTVDSPKPAGYQWTVDGQVINGATSRTIYTAVIGAYTVTVVDSNGCTATSAPFTPTAFASATVALPVIEAAPGERVKIPITLRNSENLERNKIEEFEGELRFDKSLLILADPRFTSTVDGNQQVVRINGTRPTTMNAGELLTVDFIAALGDKLTTPLELRTFIWSDALGSVPVTIEQGRFNLLDICETGGRRLLNTSGNVVIKAVRPNPALAAAEVEYEVNEHGYTQLYIVDLLGRQVAVLVDGEVEPGSYAAQFDASQLATGTYFCILQTPTVRLHHVLQVEK